MLSTLLVGCTTTTQVPSETVTSEGQRSQAPAGTTVARSDQALVRFINADAQGRTMNLYTRSGVLFQNVQFKEVTPYTPVPAEAVQFVVRTPDGGGKELASEWEEMFAGRHYSLIVVPDARGKGKLTAIDDNLSMPKEGHAKVRMINATTHVDDLNLAVSSNKEIVQKGVDPAQATRFKEVPAGDLEIRPSKQSAPPMLSQLKVAPGHFYTFVVIGPPDKLDVVTIQDELRT